tara:strand:+ start:60 stop:518 length:459 start_codon:yes stop_codon:yes gene_type:complete
MLIKHCPILSKVNNSSLQNALVIYQKINPCCEQFKTCDHPKYQSDPNLHKHFPIFKDSLESNFNINKIDRMWCFITFPKNKINSGWHSHGNNKNKFSAICYLNNTIGTEFKKGFSIEPDINTWYVWKSDIEHRPVKKYVNKLRINIVADIYL